jgi:hypothetical protein
MKNLILIILLSISIFAASVKTGDTLNLSGIQDQFEKDVKIDNNTKKIIFSFSRDNGKIVKEFFDANKDYLKNNNTLYIADMSEAPSFVLSWFMMPKFKKYDYSMGLVKDENKLNNIPRENKKITVITLENKKITNIEFVTNLK